MPRSKVSSGTDNLFTLILVIAVVAALYLAKEVLLPFALAVLLCFLLAPVVRRLERLKLGRIPAVITVVSTAFLLLGIVGWIVAGQLVDLAEKLPDYRENIKTKIEAVRTSTGVLGKIRRFGEEISHPKEASESQPAAKSPAEAVRPEPEPLPPRVVPVTVVDSTSAWVTQAQGWVTPTLGLLAEAGAVVLLAIFMLIEREDLRNRLIRLIGPGQLHATTEALDDAAERVSRYLLMQMIVNASYGFALAVGLFLIGIPNAILWGLLAGLLRYIPYVGPWIAAVIPITLSLAAFDGWHYLLLTLGLFVVLELICNNVVEPWLYGSSTGISTIGLLLAAGFWTWLWGALGLVLATPLTVCIAVMGRYVPRLEFLNVLLSDEPVLEPGVRLYQRLLAGDLEEATALAEEQAALGPLADVFDKVLLEALALAEQDAHHDRIDDSKLQYVRDSVRELVDELAEREAAAAAPPPVAGEEAPQPEPVAPGCIMCLPARDESDEIAAVMLTLLLGSRGYCAQQMSVQALASEMLEQVAERNVRAAFISAVPPFAGTHTRYLCKRLRARFPELKIIVGLWHANSGGKIEERLKAYADKVVRTLPEALEVA